MYLFFTCAILVSDLKNLTAYSAIFARKTNKDCFSTWLMSLKHWRLLLEPRATHPGNNSAHNCLRTGLSQQLRKSERICGLPRILIVPLSFSGISLPFFYGGPGCNSLRSVVHFCLLCMWASFSTKGEIFQDRNIRHHLWGWAEIWCWTWQKAFHAPLKVYPKEGSMMVEKALSWESRPPGFRAELRHLAALWPWIVMSSDHPPPSTSVCLQSELPVFSPALQ